MNTCILYAASIFDESKLNVLHDYFSIFKEYFSDADFYIGINPGSLPNLSDVIKGYGLNTTVCYAPENLYTKTDASAYQKALSALKDGNKKYDLYWFGHTKGGVNQNVPGYSRDNIRKMYLDDMFSKREEIEYLFKTHPDLGSWGIRGNSISAAQVQWRDYNVDVGIPICGNVKMPPFNYTHVNWSYIETMYVLKKEAVEAYINTLPTEFFTTKLNPWYFETVPGWIPSRCGYFPYVKVKKDYFNHCELTDVTMEWIKDNKLIHLLPLLSLQ